MKYDGMRWCVSPKKDMPKRPFWMPSECHSIKGDPATVVMRLGSVYNIEDISQKFDSIYSNVFGTEDNLAEFYSAKQKDTEDCATWSIRL